MNYNEALNLILSKQSLGIKPGLTRIKALLDSMGNPQNKIRIIHIAGTNGKGTVARFINDALIDAGYKVGLFTSPWIIDYTEQIQINNTFIPQEVFAEYVDAYRDNDCTEFEFLTAVMYKYFADSNVDWAVVECGMGGKGDSTNVEKENIAVLTSISLDHTDFLGSTIEEITKEKEGIIRDNCPCFRYNDTGNFNLDNIDLANRVLQYLGVEKAAPVKPVGRQQRIGNVLIDGGHNVEAGKVLAPVINDEIAVIGMMKDKDIDGYLSYVAPKCKKIICTNVNNKRAISAYELSRYAKKYCDDVTVTDNPRQAVKQDGVSLICGSFYLLREIMDLLS